MNIAQGKRVHVIVSSVFLLALGTTVVQAGVIVLGDNTYQGPSSAGNQLIGTLAGGSVTLFTIPEPATMSLLGLGGVFALRKRNRK